jgi:hypothetical protein
MEDLTKLLSRLIDNASELDPQGKIGSGLQNVKGHPRSGDALVTLLRSESELSGVMPKGRNFH